MPNKNEYITKVELEGEFGGIHIRTTLYGAVAIANLSIALAESLSHQNLSACKNLEEIKEAWKRIAMIEIFNKLSTPHPLTTGKLTECKKILLDVEKNL